MGRFALLAPFFAIGLLSVLAFAPTTAQASDDTRTLAQGVQTGATGMAGLSAGDAAGSTKDCACLMQTPPKPCPSPPAGACPLLGSNLASIAQALMQAASAGGSKGAVQGSEGFNYDPGDYEFDWDPGDPYTPPSFGGTGDGGAYGCTGPNPPAYLCDSNGLDQLNDDLNGIDFETVGISPTDAQGIQSSIAGINALSAGDMAGALSALGQDISALAKNGDTLNAAGAAKHGSARGFGSLGGISAGSGADSQAGFGVIAGSGKSGRRVGNIDIYLDETEWNGELDAIDSRTGKSLTLWERATRRYMGTPEGKRGFTLANIESIRYRNTPQFAAEEREKAEQRAAALAKKNTPREDGSEYRAPTSFPALISPKQLIGY